MVHTVRYLLLSLIFLFYFVTASPVSAQVCFDNSVCPQGYFCDIQVNPPGMCAERPVTGGGSGDNEYVDGQFLFDIDPLQESGLAKMIQFQTPGGILNILIPYLFTFAGLILFVMLLWGGFEMVSGAATPQSQEAGKNRITAALIGFTLLFVSYWIAQLVEFIFGLSIL